MDKGIFLRMSSWSQLLFLMLFLFGGLFIVVFIAAILTPIVDVRSIDTMRVLQLLQAILLFLVPACLCAYLFHEKPLSYLKINKPIDLKFLFVSLLLMIVIQPFIGLSGYYNNLMSLPESMADIEKVMRDMEDANNMLMEQLLTTNSLLILLFNIFIVAIMAGITEEFFFRGSLQQIFKSICSNRHIAVWITAIIFSAIHFQFYGFFPRLFLGAILGYMFVWSGNLWIPVIAHAFNNLISVLAFHFYHGTPEFEKLQAIGTTPDTIWLVVASVVLSGILLFVLSRSYIKNNSEDFAI